jgi:hypothetical protein
MKPVCLFVCVLAAGCSGGEVNTPTSPSSAAPSAASPPTSTALAHGQALPLKGSFSIATQASFNCPPTCPPTIMSVSATQEGTATHLGRFTAVQTERVDLATSASTGTYTFTAADGDELVATTVSQGEPLVPPNLSTINGTGTIVGGTGRFAGATGSFSYRITMAIDFASGTSTGSGSFEGSLDLNR